MAKNKEEKTNVMRTLEQKKIAYTAKSYPHGEGDPIDGVSVARAVGLEYDFYTAELDVPHENAVKMTFYGADGGKLDVVGASLGGGRIVITRIGEYPAEITADAPTLVIVQNDRKGMVSRVSQILASHDINIGVMRLSRTARGEVACCVIETDGELPGGVLEEIRKVPGVLSARAISA